MTTLYSRTRRPAGRRLVWINDLETARDTSHAAPVEEDLLNGLGRALGENAGTRAGAAGLGPLARLHTAVA